MFKRDKLVLKKGSVLSSNNLTTKRPGNGISAIRWKSILAKKAIKDFKKNEKIKI